MEHANFKVTTLSGHGPLPFFTGLKNTAFWNLITSLCSTKKKIKLRNKNTKIKRNTKNKDRKKNTK